MVNIIFFSIIVVIVSYLMMVLISFDPSDPSWLQINWNDSIHNFGGIIGAQCADFLFFMFGALAYVIPLFILIYSWTIYIQQNYFLIFMKIFELIGFLILLCVCCGAMHLIIINNNFFYFSSGGVVGHILCDWISSYKCLMPSVSIVLFLLGMIGLILIFNRFFIDFIEIKKKRLVYDIGILKKYFFRNKKKLYQGMCCKLYDQIRIDPTIFFTQEDDLLRKSQYKHTQRTIPLFSISVMNAENISARSCANIKNNNLFNISTLNNATTYQVKCLSSDMQNHCPENYVKKIDDFKRKNDSIVSDRYSKRLHKNDMLCILKNRDYKNDNLLKDNLNLIGVLNSKNILKKNISKKQHVNQLCSSVLQQKNSTIILHNTKHNMQSIFFPDVNLLMKSIVKNTVNTLELKNISKLLEKKLAEYRILINVVNIIPGPIIIRFELNLSPGIKSAKIVSLSRDLARSLSVTSVRVVEVIPGTPYVGIEIPNKERRIVCLRDIIDSNQFRKIKTPLALALGQDIAGNPIIEDLRGMPHLLVAGTTGSGKSVGINAMIISILYKATPDEVRFIMIDPKILELSVYSKIPHILKKVITNMQDVDATLKWCVQEVERRYQLMAKIGVRNLENYNCYIEQLYSEKCVVQNFVNNFNRNIAIHSNTKFKKLPYIVVIIDEFSDLMIVSAKKIEELIVRLTQKARAAGIHLILATQRPSVNVITGLIKANIPARIAFTVSSKIDSHTIIGQSGAESLLGAGDMLYLAANSSIPMRIHGACIRDQEVRAIVDFFENKKNNRL